MHRLKVKDAITLGGTAGCGGGRIAHSYEGLLSAFPNNGVFNGVDLAFATKSAASLL